MLSETRSFSHLIMLLGVGLILSDRWLRVLACSVVSKSVTHKKRPSAYDYFKNFSDWERRSQTYISITKPGPPQQGTLFSWLVSVSAAVRSQYWFAMYTETKQGNFLFYYILITVALWNITFLQFFKSVLSNDPMSSSTNNRCWCFADCSVSKQYWQISSWIYGCQHWNVRSFVSINVILCKETFSPDWDLQLCLLMHEEF